MSTFIFNYFVLAAIFNEFNARELGDDPLGAFTNLMKNKIFLVIIAISIALQAIFVEAGGEFFKTTGLTGLHWGYTVGLAALQFPLVFLIRFIPVPERELDYATTFSKWFGEQMDNRSNKDRTAVVVDNKVEA